MFLLHPKIRWVGLASEKGDVIFVKMRPGVNSLSPEEEDRSFMELNPLLILGACGRLSKWAGDVESIAIRYEKVVMFLIRNNGKILALTMEKNGTPEGDHKIIATLSQSLQSMMS